MTDIVDRLRHSVHTRWFDTNTDWPMLKEAADEIERLRGEYRTMRSYARHRPNCAREFPNFNQPTALPNPCDCGYDDLFRAKGPRQQELQDYDDTFQ